MVYAVDFSCLGLLVNLELTVSLKVMVFTAVISDCLARYDGLDGGDFWRLCLMLRTRPGMLLSTSSLAIIGMPGADWFAAGKTCTGGGAWRFGAGSKGGGNGEVSCISVNDHLGLVGGSGSGLAGLSVIIGPA